MTTQDPRVPDPEAPQGARPGDGAAERVERTETPGGGIHSTVTFDRVGAAEPDYTPASALAPGDRAAIEALPPRSALLIVQHGPNAGSRFLLDAERVTAGRHTSADIFLDDVTVSRTHAEFHAEGEGYAVRDVGSLNGTYVNRQRIDEAVLQPGDEVQIGKYRLTYHPSPNRAATAEGIDER